MQSKNAATAQELQSQDHVLQGIIKDLKARVNESEQARYSVGSDGFDFGNQVRFQEGRQFGSPNSDEKVDAAYSSKDNGYRNGHS